MFEQILSLLPIISAITFGGTVGLYTQYRRQQSVLLNAGYETTGLKSQTIMQIMLMIPAMIASAIIFSFYKSQAVFNAEIIVVLILSIAFFIIAPMFLTNNISRLKLVNLRYKRACLDRRAGHLDQQIESLETGEDKSGVLSYTERHALGA